MLKYLIPACLFILVLELGITGEVKYNNYSFHAHQNMLKYIEGQWPLRILREGFFYIFYEFYFNERF